MLKKCIAEFIGTFVIVVFGCGVAVATGCSDNGGIVATALAFGLVIVAMAYSIGNISGCHINPAVSTAMLVSGKMTAKDYVGYVLSQILGALAADGGDRFDVRLCARHFGRHEQNGEQGGHGRCHRACAYPRAPARHPSYGHVRQPRPLHRSRNSADDRRRLYGNFANLDLHRRPHFGRGACGGAV